MSSRPPSRLLRRRRRRTDAGGQPPIDVNPFAPGRGPYSRAAVGSIRRPDPTKINTLTRAHANTHTHRHMRSRTRTQLLKRAQFSGLVLFFLLVFLRYLYRPPPPSLPKSIHIYTRVSRTRRRAPARQVGRVFAVQIVSSAPDAVSPSRPPYIACR